jgi:uroporphyrinogen III methyltransferase/synthase
LGKKVDPMDKRKGKPLVGKRIVVPPSRPEANLLLDMLRLRGAEALEFPKLTASAPGDLRPIDRAIDCLDQFDWIVFSGGRCLRTFVERLEAKGRTVEALRSLKICALGRGTVSSLRDHGVAMDFFPRVHAPETVAEGLGEVRGLRFLLVRHENAPAELRRRLREKGASVAWASGCRLVLEADARLAWRVFGRKPDAIALASPTTVHYLVRGAEMSGLDLKKATRNVPVAAIGPATAKRARELGLEPSLVSKGHLVDIAEDHTEQTALPL